MTKELLAKVTDITATYLEMAAIYDFKVTYSKRANGIVVFFQINQAVDGFSLEQYEETHTWAGKTYKLKD